jgi:hypothetical protein
MISGRIEYKNIVTETDVCLPFPPASGRIDEKGRSWVSFISAVEKKRIVFIIRIVEKESNEFILLLKQSGSQDLLSK